MTSSPSHVAVLVPSVVKAAEYLRQFDFDIGPEESFEETKEIYVQGDQANPLLLMEAKESGSYRRALEKRGPGVHHLAIDVLDLEKFLGTLGGSGWLLHLNSLKSMNDYKTAYLARPGFPALIEVQEKKKLRSGPYFVSALTLDFKPEHQRLVEAVGLGSILKPSPAAQSLSLGGRTIALRSLV